MTRNTTCHVLVVEDDADHCEMIEVCLTRSGRERIEITCVHTLRAARQRLLDEQFDFVLLDHNLPDGHGSELLEEMSERLLTTPVIGLSTSADPEVALQDFRGGAIDFIQKHEAFQGDTLRRRVFEALANHKRRIAAHALERSEVSTHFQHAAERIIAAARVDTVMGIASRAVYEEFHPEMHRAALESGESYAVCVVDLDRFKRYNDRYGHAAGDAALRSVAQAIDGTLRSADLIARYGGEEIVVLLANVDHDSAAQGCERLRIAVSDLKVPHEALGPDASVTVSVGVAVFDPASGELPVAVFERADRALYQAKDDGRNRTVVAAPKSAMSGSDQDDRVWARPEAA